MSMYPWRAGEVITAEKLVSGIQYGVVAVEFDEQDNKVENTTSNYQHFASFIYVSSVDVVFDVPFVEVPIIQITPRTAYAGIFIEATYTNVTPTGFTISAARRTFASTNIDWLAIGRPAL